MSATSGTDGGGNTTALYRGILTFIMLLSGTANTISKSIQNNSISEGIGHEHRTFTFVRLLIFKFL
jgi:hypothetical protein